MDNLEYPFLLYFYEYPFTSLKLLTVKIMWSTFKQLLKVRCKAMIKSIIIATFWVLHCLETSIESLHSYFDMNQ